MLAEQAAAVAAAKAAWNVTPTRTHEVGAVPADPVLPYQVISTDSGLPGTYRLLALHGTRQHRIVVQCVGGTFKECAFAAEKADAAFLNKRLTIGSKVYGPGVLELAASPRRDPDAGGLIYALATYTFTAAEE